MTLPPAAANARSRVQHPPVDHRRGWNDHRAVDLTAQILQAAVRERDDRGQRIEVDVVEVDLMLHELGHQLDRDVVRFLVAEPHAVRRVIQRDLGRRASDRQQVARPVDVPGDGRGGIRAAG